MNTVVEICSYSIHIFWLEFALFIHNIMFWEGNRQPDDLC